MFNETDVARMWEENAETWTMLARMGCDVYRDHCNTPAFMSMLPDVRGLTGLDIGCGEGHNTRMVARRGAAMTGIDIAETFLTHAREMEEREPLGIQYQNASALSLPFESESFDFAVAFMSLMDMPHQDVALREAFRVLKPGGFFQFSICHPCFQTPRWRWVLDENGNKAAMECGDYFIPPDGAIDEWMFSDAPREEQLRPFRIPFFRQTLSWWLNQLIDSGFILERFTEPTASDEALRDYPRLADTRIIAYFLIIRARKPAHPAMD